MAIPIHGRMAQRLQRSPGSRAMTVTARFAQELSGKWNS